MIPCGPAEIAEWPTVQAAFWRVMDRDGEARIELWVAGISDAVEARRAARRISELAEMHQQLRDAFEHYGAPENFWRT